MRYKLIILLLGVFFISSNCEQNQVSYTIADPVRLSQDFLLAIKTEQPFKQYEDTLSHIDLKALKISLNSPEKKLTFWINTYNSLVQAKIRKDPDAFEKQKEFFNDASEVIGGIQLSLNDIETGILRLQPVQQNEEFIADFKVEKLDPRIHFTLNCGATSCPPVAYYSPDKLDEQLELATESFVSQTSAYDASANLLTVSQLFEWYADDFGGYEGIIDLCKRLKIIDENLQPKLAYTPYDWHLDIENFE